MATKTITLELDAYEKLFAAKRGKESFSSVVRRATLPEVSKSGKELIAIIQARTPLFSDEEIDAMEKAAKHDPAPGNPWDEE